MHCFLHKSSFWWAEVDSNHRSRRRQIYSLIHLAALESAQVCNFVKIIKIALDNQGQKMATQNGLEPSTSSVTGWRSNQLSYWAIHKFLSLVGLHGFEPRTNRL